MKIATFNIQNIYYRNRELIQIPWNKSFSDWLWEMDFLIGKEAKVPRDFERMKELSFLLGFEKVAKDSYAILRKRGGELFVHHCNFPKESKASEFNSWNGWVAVQSVPLDFMAVQNKAKVIAEVNADILILQEVEDKSTFTDFNQKFLPDYNCVPYKDLLVLQGNDDRGQELAYLSKNGFIIKSVYSYLSERDNNNDYLFEKNVIKYEVLSPSQTSIWIVAAHFIDTGKDMEYIDSKRFRQATKVAEIYQQLIEEGKKNVVVLGTLNAVSYCYSLSPLLQKTGLKDITRHSAFNVDFDEGRDASYYRMGAYKMGVNLKQKDYLLLSPELFTIVKRGGLNRKAVFPSKKLQWPVYSSVTVKEHAASEHPIIWAELDV